MPEVTRRPERPVRTVLGNREFRLLWLAGLISYVGNWSMFAALPLYVFRATGSALASGAVLTAMYVPLLFGSLAGVFVDRWDRRRTLQLGNLAMAVLGLPMLVAATGHGLWVAYLVMVVVGLISQFTMAAENALLPRLVAREHLLAANSLNSLNDNLARIVGPALGGLVGAWVGLTGVVIMNTACFLAAACLITLMRVAPTALAGGGRSDPAPAGLWAEWRAGLRMISGVRMLAMIFVVGAVTMLADSVLSALLAPFVVSEISPAAWMFGLLLALRGVGGLLGGLLTGFLSHRLTPARTLGVSLISIGLLLAVLVNVSAPMVAYVTITLMGVLAIPGLASQQTLLQTSADESYLGRVFGALGTTSALTMLVGSLLGGWLAEIIGVLPVLNASAALYGVAGLLGLILLRSGPGDRQSGTPDGPSMTLTRRAPEATHPC